MRKLMLWGHGSKDYLEMFDLKQEDLHGNIMEFACGPSLFNLEQRKSNQMVKSCDPLFVLDKDTLYSKSCLMFAEMAEQVASEQDHFDFSRCGGLEAFLSQRKDAMEHFFADYEQGKSEGNYLGLVEHYLPFEDFSFDLALCSHYLFADLDNQTVELHLSIICELARVAREVRVFPLVDTEGKTSELLGPVLLGLQQHNYGVEVREIPFQLYKSGNAMLRVWAQQCHV
jgi:hypothetical protein